MQSFSRTVLYTLTLGLVPLGAMADDLTALWSYGLVSKRTGEPIIEEGGQHRIDPTIVDYGYNQVVDRKGTVLKPSGRPLHGGEQLVRTDSYVEDANTREYARIVSIMAPIRDAILYDFETMDRDDWTQVTAILTANGIKTKDADRIVPRAILSTDQVWDYVASGKAEGSEVMRYLEEAGLELKCLAFTGFDFTNPEGANHCEDHGFEIGSGIKLP